MLLRILLTILAVATSLAFKFNHPRILLPLFDNVRINYTLQVVEQGCFDFSISSGPELIKIQPLYEDDGDCSHKVLITATSREKSKKTAIILAESRETGEVLRCDVILDRIHKFGVHTTTRELYLEEAAETFELMAQDSQGNDFTTLEGVEFNWKIGIQSRASKETDKDSKSRYQVLRFLTFSESKYHQVPKEVEKFEMTGLKGHMVLLEGINSGSAKVIVKLPYSEYQNVAEVEVDITVLANLIIAPVDVHILVGDSINFKVLQLKQGKLHEITLGAQYYLQIENQNTAKIDGGVATGISLGTTSVILMDNNVIENTIKTPMPKARLTVSEADKITLNLLPYYNWITVADENHDIAIDLYTKDDRKITLGNRYKLKSSFDKSLFKELKRNNNGSRISGETINTGTNPVSGTFEHLTANAEMLIYGKINLTPALVILPYDVNKPVKQRIQFQATGGDGSFTWSTANPVLLSVTQNGLGESHLDRFKDAQYDVSRSGVTIGTTVKAAIARNSKIFKTSEVLFLPPVKLEIVGYNFETSLHDHVDVHVALSAFYNKSFLPFTSCENLHFDIEFSSQIFTIISMESEETVKINNACRLVRLKGIHTGSSTMTITYKHGDEILRDEIQLMVYERLIVYNPVSNIVVLPVGSSRNVIYQHGPRKNFNVGGELVRDFQYSKNLITLTEVKSDFQDQRFAYNILCRKIGDSKVHLEVYNSLNQENFIKYTSIIETAVHCVKPRFINLYTLDKLKTSCPIDSSNSLMHVRSMQNALDIEIEILDQHKRKLENITSLVIDWVFSQTNGVISHNIAYNRETEVDEIDHVPIPKRDFLRTSITEINLNHKIKAIVIDYDEAVLKELKIQAEIPSFGIPKSAGSHELQKPIIENELDFLSFDSSLLPFNSISVYLSPGTTKRIKLGQGSGYYEIKVKDPMLLDVEHDKTLSELVLKPKKIGETTIRIIDRCLKTDPSILEVSIVAVGRVELASPDRVEKGKSIEAIAKLYDSNELLMDIDYENLGIYQLNENAFHEKILTIKRGQQQNLQKGEIRYVITGTELGETKVVVRSGSVQSSFVQVQVFPPLQLIPRNATILVGSNLEISSRGGPKPDSNIVYHVANSDILSIDGSVVEGLKVGKTKVIGRCVGINPTDGSTTVFTEDFIFINVVPLSKVKIKMPLQRLKSEAIMPASLWAEPDISPMVLGTLKNLKIHWRTDSPDVIELRDIFEDIGVIYGEGDSISMRVRGLKQGKGKIYATVTLGGSKYQAITELKVFKTLELESPKRIIHDPIIVPPKMTIQLKANLDEAVFDISDQADKNIINVSRDGTVRTFDMLGTSLVVATCVDQKLDIPVEVKNIHYIMATVVSNVQLKGIADRLPKDLNLVLSVSLHDNLGNKFSHNFDDLKWKLTNRDSVDVRVGDNFTMSVGLLRDGSNVMSISLRNQVTGIKYPEDFVKLAVHAPTGIFGKKLMATVGDFICFESPLTDGQVWSSNSEAVILSESIGRITSVPVTQKATVFHGQRDGVYIDYQLEIRTPDRVQFRKSFDIYNGEKHRSYFTISNHQQVEKTSNLITSNKTYCEGLQENFLIDFVACKLTSHDDAAILKKFETSTVFDKSVGSYACEIRVLTSIDDITSISRNKNINLQLEARLIPSGIFDKVDLKLTPAIQILPLIITIDKLPQQEIIISGMENILQKVEVTSSHPDNLVLIPLPKANGRLTYKLKLLNAASVNSELYVKIDSPLTHQMVQIPIVPTSPKESESKDSANILFAFLSNTGKVIAVVVVVLTTVILILLCFRNRDLNASGVFQTPANRQNPSQPFMSPNANATNSNVFAASPLQSQRMNSSPIRRSPVSVSQPENPIYGNPELSSPFRRINKRMM